MRLLTVELSTLADNLALDEAMLESVSAEGDTFRLWEVQRPSVVLGRASRIDMEVEEEFCRQNDVPIVRRCSGGLSVVVMKGCLLYSVVLRLAEHPDLRVIDRAHAYVLDRVARAIRTLDVPVVRDGTSDLTLHGQKFSGNSLRCKQDGILYHGTLLVDAPLELIARCLKMPPRQPEYRRARSHDDFLVNLHLPMDALRAALIQEFCGE